METDADPGEEFDVLHFEDQQLGEEDDENEEEGKSGEDVEEFPLCAEHESRFRDLKLELEEDQAARSALDCPNIERGDGAAGEERAPEPFLGMEFDSLDSANAFYLDYAQRLGFRVRASRFRTSRRDESIIMRRFVCSKEGFYLKNEKKMADAKERRKRGSIREGCQAMFEVVKKGPDRWIVSKLVKDHSHAFSGGARAHNRRKKKAETVCFSPPGAIVVTSDDDPRRRSYWGGGGEAFNLLEYLKRMQVKNPGFFYSLQVDGQSNLVTDVFWADARARTAFASFGDAVSLDTTYRKTKQMIPFVSFTGVNHHLQPVIFACGLIFEETERSFAWLLETFSLVMNGRAPASLVTEPDENLRSAVLRVFPGTRHRFCKRRILHRAKAELPQLSSDAAAWRAFKIDFRRCVDEVETAEDLESCWESILRKYDLAGSSWIHSLYEQRELWAAAFFKDGFFAEMSPTQKSETMDKFFRRNFEGRASVRDFLIKFDRAMAGQVEKEVQADCAIFCSGSALKTSSVMEKQAAEVYTNTVFAYFQEELLRSAGARHTGESDDGVNWKYDVVDGGGDTRKAYRVDFNYPEKRASCSCRRFDFSGILCSHILAVFSSLQIARIPEDYFLRRWRRNATGGSILLESAGGDRPTDRRGAFSSLCTEIFRYAGEGATSSAAYAAAKDGLRKAFAEVIAAKKGFTR